MTTAEEVRSLYRTMARIRAFEERVGRHFRDGDIHGFVHVSLGQEATAAGVCSCLSEQDVITTTHRGHGHCIAKGADVGAMMAELFGRETGICRGKGGSMHIADPRLGILGANGIVGAGIPIAVGAALASTILAETRIAVAFFGEGAVHTGAFHEGLCLATAWSLPVVFVCENNGYAEFTRSDRWHGPRPSERAAGYGVRATTVDGRDVIAVRDSLTQVIERVRGGGGPEFVEAMTDRFSGHYEGDAQPYRLEGEIAELSSRDPLVIARRHLEHAEWCSEVDIAAEEEMRIAVEAAFAAPYPPDEALYEDVFA